MSPLEALADAVMNFEGWDKGTRSWRNRSPGNLRPFNASQPVDSGGYRIFDTLADGWIALRADLSSKFAGSHGLTPSSTILDLINIYAPAGDANNPSSYTQFVCAWTSYCLGATIVPTTTLSNYLQTKVMT